jgi:hypothetical protein
MVAPVVSKRFDKNVEIVAIWRVGSTNPVGGHYLVVYTPAASHS